MRRLKHIDWQMVKTRTAWYIKQTLPLHYESRFKEDGKSILCQWRMWLGRCFNVRSWELAG